MTVVVLFGRFNRLHSVQSKFLPSYSSFAMNQQEQSKKIAARKAVDNHVKGDMAVGVGSGSTIVYAVERLAERVKNERLNIVCVPTSFQARQLIIEHKLVLTDLHQHPQLDVAIDGADETDDNLTAIKGGGACQTQEKIVASAAREFIIVADYRKNSKQLGQSWKGGVPIEVIPMSYTVVKSKIETQLGGLAELRMAKMKAGPVVTDNGNFVLDWKFPLEKTHDWSQLNVILKMLPGVVETGLFVGMAAKAYYGNEDGSVTEKLAPS